MLASCTICSDQFDGVRVIVTISCGHVFHEHCIYQWMERSKTCPECRTRITSKSLTKLFFNIIDNEDPLAKQLLDENSVLESKVRLKDQEVIKLQAEKEEMRVRVSTAELRACVLQEEIYSKITNNNALKSTINSLKIELELLHNIQTMITGTQVDVDNLLLNVLNRPDASKNLAIHCSILKRESLRASEYIQQKMSSLRNENMKLRGKVLGLEAENSILSERLSKINEQNYKDKLNSRNPVPIPTNNLPTSSENECLLFVPSTNEFIDRNKAAIFNFSGKKMTFMPLSVGKTSPDLPNQLEQSLSNLYSDVEVIFDSRQTTDQNNDNSVMCED